LALPDDDGTDVTRPVLHLVDRSLITTGRDSSAARYRLLETLRGYRLERLEERGDPDAAHGRHARWAVELVTQAARDLRGAARPGGRHDSTCTSVTCVPPIAG
jgi:predicted ATPase